MQSVNLKESGQAALEYILLMVLVVSMIKFVFQDLGLGEQLSWENSELMEAINGKFRYTYRHALDGNKLETFPPDYSSTNHDSYSSNGETRFFGPARGYP